MIDHIGIKVADLAKSTAFYEKALAPLGYSLLRTYGDFVGFGAERKPDFWLSPAEKRAPMHVAFVAADRATVDRFHAAALAAGGVDDGAPGPRPHYHANYYGAFVLDPDGNHVEAVCHKPA